MTIDIMKVFRAVTGQYHPNNSLEYKTAQNGGTLVSFTVPFNSMFKTQLTIILFFTAISHNMMKLLQ